MILLLTLFQDNYVRAGTLLGVIAGIWSPEMLNREPVNNIIILGFIGWGIGAYLGYSRDGSSQSSKKRKFRVFDGGR
jgi:F0F1-type ATP synthase assembly protein I